MPLALLIASEMILDGCPASRSLVKPLFPEDAASDEAKTVGDCLVWLELNANVPAWVGRGAVFELVMDTPRGCFSREAFAVLP